MNALKMVSALLVTGLVSLQYFSNGAFAQPIPVPNFSFETDIQTTDPAIGDGAADWISIGTTYTDNPPSFEFIGAGGFGTPTGGLGAQSGLMFGSSSFQSAFSLATILGPTTYTLTIAIGDRASESEEPGILRIGFLVGDAFVPGGDTSFAAENFLSVQIE